jgi:hypothetical protein
MMARNPNVPFKGRIQKRKTNQLQIITFGLQRAAGPYRSARSGPSSPQGGKLPASAQARILQCSNCGQEETRDALPARPGFVFGG